MKLLVDVNLSPKVVAELCAVGHDAVRASEVLDASAEDEAILVEHAALAKLIDAVVRDASTDLAVGAIVTVDDPRVRTRRLPIG